MRIELIKSSGLFNGIKDISDRFGPSALILRNVKSNGQEFLFVAHENSATKHMLEDSKNIREELSKLNVSENKNIVISGHNGVIDQRIFDDVKSDTTFCLEEGGFYVIKNLDGKLVLLDKFHSFQDFYRNFNFREY